MLNSVEVRTRQGNLLTLPLESASGYIVEEIEGLDPVNAILVSSSFATADGQQYHSSRRDARNIKVKLSLEPDYTTQTVQALRQTLYEFLMPKTVVTLVFVGSEGDRVEIEGHVESNQSPQFTKEPKSDISLMCYDPDFIDPDPVVIPGLSTDTSDEMPVEYDGSVETGLVLTVSPDRSLSEFTVYHRPPDGTLRILEFATPLSAGDVLRISTVSGAKGVTLTRSGTESSALYGISPQSNWLELERGTNYIRLYAEGLPIPYEIEYINRYGGL